MKKFLIYNQEIENEKTKLAETDPIIERLKSPLEEKSFYYKSGVNKINVLNLFKIFIW